MNSVVISDYEQGHFTCLTPEFFLIGIRFEPSINSVFASVYRFLFFEDNFSIFFPIFFHFSRSNEFHTASWWQKLKHRCSAIWAKCRFFRNINEIYINSLYDIHYEPYYPMGKLIGIRFKPSINSVFASVYKLLSFSIFRGHSPIFFHIFLVQTNSIQLLDDKNRNIDVQPFEQNVGFLGILMKFT